MEDLLYCRGFCLTNSTNNYLESKFNKFYLDGCNIFYFHDWLDFSCYKKNNKEWVAIAGLCIDIKNKCSDLEVISQRAARLMSIGENYFHEYLDFLSGSFILICKTNNELRFYTDACASRASFYVYINDIFYVSSHLGLVSKVSNHDGSYSDQFLKKSSKVNYEYGYPGNTTIFKDIMQLSPNTYLNLYDKSINRFFPRGNLEINKNIEAIILEIKAAFELQTELIIKKGNGCSEVLMSLTAGQDSRFTLACLRDFTKHISFFTYCTNDSHKKDMKVAKNIASIMKLRHIDISIESLTDEEQNEFNAFDSITNNNVIAYNHARKISYYYWKKLPQNSIHIRSNLAEIGRLYYGGFAYFWELTSDSSSKVIDKVLRAYSPNSLDSDVVISSFEDFIERNDYDNLYNYDVFDIFYWEYRMGIWLSQVALESNTTFETINLFNCRYLLNLILSLNMKDRFKGIVFKKAIDDFLPELSETAIN